MIIISESQFKGIISERMFTFLSSRGGAEGQQGGKVAADSVAVSDGDHAITTADDIARMSCDNRFYKCRGLRRAGM